jgi:hypothetical protein
LVFVEKFGFGFRTLFTFFLHWLGNLAVFFGLEALGEMVRVEKLGILGNMLSISFY